MYMRWRVGKDDSGVDFSLWKSITPSVLYCPLDVHSGKLARIPGIITCKQNDAKAVSEVDMVLRSFDKDDPVKYDLALFGLSISEKFLTFTIDIDCSKNQVKSMADFHEVTIPE